MLPSSESWTVHSPLKYIPSGIETMIFLVPHSFCMGASIQVHTLDYQKHFVHMFPAVVSARAL